MTRGPRSQRLTGTLPGFYGVIDPSEPTRLSSLALLAPLGGQAVLPQVLGGLQHSRRGVVDPAAPGHCDSGGALCPGHCDPAASGIVIQTPQPLHRLASQRFHCHCLTNSEESRFSHKLLNICSVPSFLLFKSASF